MAAELEWHFSDEGLDAAFVEYNRAITEDVDAGRELKSENRRAYLGMAIREYLAVERAARVAAGRDADAPPFDMQKEILMRMWEGPADVFDALVRDAMRWRAARGGDAREEGT